MTYSVPDPASESTDPIAPDPVGSRPSGATPSGAVGPDGSGVHSVTNDDPPLPRQAEPAGFDAMAAGSDDASTANDQSLRVAHEDSEEYDQFVADPEAAEEATRARMNAQAEAEKAAAGVNPDTGTTPDTERP
jgi:hypothetical protein